MRTWKKTAAGASVLAAAAMVGSLVPAQAAPVPLPDPGAPLVGGFCTGGLGSITGVGASFANQAHNDVFIPEFNARCGAGAGKVSYAGGGSGAGITGALAHTSMLTGSDEPLSADQQAQGELDLVAGQNRISPMHHIPIALGSVTTAVNLASCGITGREKVSLRSTTIAKMYAGVVTKWNSPLVIADNLLSSADTQAKLAACSAPVRVVARSDGSGTTYAFKDYLSKRNPEFQAYKQNQLNTAWPGEDAGLVSVVRGNGNSGVANAVKATPGSIGYVSLATALDKGNDWALVDGPHGVFVSPADPAQASKANCDLAAAGAAHPPSTLSRGWDAVSITDSPNPLAYPICTFTYLLTYNNLGSAFPNQAAQARTLASYLTVALSDSAQSKLANQGYGALPANMLVIAKAGLATMNTL